MESERFVAGLRCGEVLADLSEYLDQGLTPERRGQLEAHVRGCDYCERFGREFSSAIKALRAQLADPDAVAADVVARLRERLRKERE